MSDEPGRDVDDQDGSEHSQANDREQTDQDDSGHGQAEQNDEVETVTGRPVGEPREGLVQKLQREQSQTLMKNTLAIYGALTGVYVAFIFFTGLFSFGAGVFATPAGSVLIGIGPVLALYTGQSFTAIEDDQTLSMTTSFLANAGGYLGALIVLGLISAVVLANTGFAGPFLARLVLPALFAVAVVGGAGAARTYYELNY